MHTEAQISRIAGIAEKKIRKGIWRTYLTVNRSELSHSGYAAPNGLADASGIATEVLNVL